MSAQTSSKQDEHGDEKHERRRGGWSERAFEEIIQQFISRAEPGKFYVYDIASPPGSGKTFTVLKFLVTRRLSAVCSFPTHQNQSTALSYIVSQVKKTGKLRHFVLDYAGLENYCLFHRPALLRKLLDQYRENGESYVTAAQKLLGEDVMFRALLLRDTFTIAEKIYTEIAEMFDQNKSDKEVVEYTRDYVERRGQYEVCLGVCPVGLLFTLNRGLVYSLLSKPKIITWRYSTAEKIMKKHNFKNVIVANPSRLVSNIKNISSEKVNPEWLLCPRLLLIKKSSVIKTKDGRRVPVYLALKRVLILTPHAGLQFVLNTITRQLEVSGVDKKFMLYIDEYDALLKPKNWRLFSINEAKTMKAIADKVLSMDEGEELKGVVIDEYIKRYASYVSYVVGKIIEKVENSIKTGEYTPYSILFVEGAFSRFRETTLETKIPIEYLPLGARVVHIKHMLSDEELFKLIVNPKIYFADLSAKDPDWVVRFREAVAGFRQIIKKTRTISLKPVKVKYDRVYIQLLPREVYVSDLLSEISDLMKYLLYTPRLAVYYAVKDKELVAESLDASLSVFLTWSKHAILTSATPIHYDLLVMGTNSTLPQSDYESIVKNNSFSFAKFSSPVEEEYDQYTVKKYIGKLLMYTEEYSKTLRDSVASNTQLFFNSSCVMTPLIEVSQISPLTRIIREYGRMIKVLPQPSLKPLTQNMITTASSKNLEPLMQATRSYIVLVDALIRQGHRVLLLTQNKVLALFFVKLLKMIPCHGDTCGEKVDKISHFKTKDERILLTWFRSRIGRGVDIDVRTDVVVTVGSPYPQPRVLVNYKTYERLFDSRLVVTYALKPFNSIESVVVYKTLIPRDYVSGLSELAQALGRAIRSIMSLEHGEVRIYIPQYVYTKFLGIAPLWLRGSTTSF